MTRFVCEECGHLRQFPGRERRAFRAPCPACETATQWTVAFTADPIDAGRGDP